MSEAAGVEGQATEERAPITVGSVAHKELFCGVLLDTFDPYKPAVIDWPPLAPAARTRLAGLPFWDLALETEDAAARRMQALADVCDDPLIREAVSLNAFEERRHKEVLGRMLAFYGIAAGGDPEAALPRDPLWAFLRTGYGECFDTFFAFGLFELGRRVNFAPAPLMEVFEPVVQEEARHNIFFVNWVAYMRARYAWPRRAAFVARSATAMVLQAAKRLGAAKKVDGSNFTRTGSQAIGVDLNLRDFLALCVAEQERRMARYDPRLLRPRIMPMLARAAISLMSRRAA